MKPEKAEVKSKGSIVGVAEFYVYDSVDEAVEHQGQDVVLDLINVQAKTSAMNGIRQEATAGSKVTKKSLELFMTRATPEEFADLQAAYPQGDEAVAEVVRRVLQPAGK